MRKPFDCAKVLCWAAPHGDAVGRNVVLVRCIQGDYWVGWVDDERILVGRFHFTPADAVHDFAIRCAEYRLFSI